MIGRHVMGRKFDGLFVGSFFGMRVVLPVVSHSGQVSGWMRIWFKISAVFFVDFC